MFAARYQNDRRGEPAYDPALLLKVILYSYSKGITSSRGIEALCREGAAAYCPHRFFSLRKEALELTQ